MQDFPYSNAKLFLHWCNIIPRKLYVFHHELLFSFRSPRQTRKWRTFHPHQNTLSRRIACEAVVMYVDQAARYLRYNITIFTSFVRFGNLSTSHNDTLNFDISFIGNRFRVTAYANWFGILRSASGNICSVKFYVHAILNRHTRRKFAAIEIVATNHTLLRPAFAYLCFNHIVKWFF